MHSVLRAFSFYLLLALGVVVLTGCERVQSEPEGDAEAVFLDANPPVDGVLEYPPRSLRVFLSELPDVDASSLKLTGPQGEVPLRGFHTMGADDLMIEIDEYPLPNGEYTVEWSAKFVDGKERYSGSYKFSVNAAQ